MSRTSYKAFVFLAIILSLCAQSLSAQISSALAVKVYDYPEKDGIEGMSDYDVLVRDAGGDQWVEVKTLRCDVDMHKVQKASFAEFDMAKPVVVRVRNNRDDALQAGRMDVIVRPLSRKIKAIALPMPCEVPVISVFMPFSF